MTTLYAGDSVRTAEMPTDQGYRHREDCRACGGSRLEVFLDLGHTPLANHFLTEDQLGQPEALFPLVVSRCQQCGLAQLQDAVDPVALFSNYLYFSSSSAPVIEHNREVATTLIERYINSPQDLVCEIGSNDGVFLQHFLGRCHVLGIDPAENVAASAAAKGVPTITRFFNVDAAREVRAHYGSARLVFAANVLAHIDDLEGAMAGVAELLAPEGVLVFEVHRSLDLLRERHFDQVYHEHLCYWALRPIEVMLARYGLRAIDVRLIPMQGESYQVHAARIGSTHQILPSVAAILEQERELGVESPEPYREFSGQVDAARHELRDLIVRLRAEGRRVVGYGAPAKATTLLAATGLGREHLDYITDSTPAKQGRYMPGNHIPIRAPDALHEDVPDYVLLLAWNFADSILEQERELRRRGVHFILPLPRPVVINGE